MNPSAEEAMQMMPLHHHTIEERTARLERGENEVLRSCTRIESKLDRLMYSILGAAAALLAAAAALIGDLASKRF